MVTKQDLTGAEAYIAHADRLIEKRPRPHRSVAQPPECRRCRRVGHVLTAFRTNVENRYCRLQRDAALATKRSAISSLYRSDTRHLLGDRLPRIPQLPLLLCRRHRSAGLVRER
jgi:hypothetical protein